MSDSDDMYAVCTKCGLIQTGLHLSRFCTRCNYMRLVRKVGESEEEGERRDAMPLSGEELDLIWKNMGLKGNG